MQPDVITTFGSHTCVRFDNLRLCMRDMYYALLGTANKPTHIFAGRVAAHGYDGLLVAAEDPTTISAPPVTFFKDLPVIFDQTLPGDEMQFMCLRECVGVIRGIS